MADRYQPVLYLFGVEVVKLILERVGLSAHVAHRAPELAGYVRRHRHTVGLAVRRSDHDHQYHVVVGVYGDTKARRNPLLEFTHVGRVISPTMAVAKVRGSAKGQVQKVHAGRYVHDEAFDENRHDLTSWMETPASSRVSGFRYDHMNQALQVTWRNNTNHGYIYLDVPYESYRSFARAASKGRYVNSTLNGFDYRLMTPDEVQADSNPDRPGITSRVRG